MGCSPGSCAGVRVSVRGGSGGGVQADQFFQNGLQLDTVGCSKAAQDARLMTARSAQQRLYPLTSNRTQCDQGLAPVR